MKASWQQRLDRAVALAAHDEATASLMTSYARLLSLQRDCHDSLRRVDGLTGDLERDLSAVRGCVTRVLMAVGESMPPAIAEDAARLREGGTPAADAMLVSAWRDGHAPFFARLVLQPYAERVVALGLAPSGCARAGVAHACPTCGAAPQLSILHHTGDGDGGARALLCSLCGSVWPLRRVVCPACDESDERQLAYFRAPEFDHLRVDACDACRRYLKTVDLTRLGLAVPVVDEVAGASLDLWAMERGYQKVEVNVMGL